MSNQVSGANPELSTPNVAVATRALFLGFALLMVGNGLQGSLIGIRSQAEGFGIGVSGLIMAAYFAGFFAGSGMAARALSSVGHIRVFAALASTASSAVLLHSVFVTPLIWIGARFAFGLCMAGLYVVVESWLNDLASNETRGRLLSVYMVVSLGGLSLGQVLLNVADSNGFVLFVLASVLVSMALVPVSLSGTTAAPELKLAKPMRMRELIRSVPSGVVGSAGVGAATGVMLAMGPVYGAATGMSTQQIGAFVAAPMIGGVALQWPLGWLSDKVSRRPIILTISTVAAIVGLTMTQFDGYLIQVGAMFLLGGAVFPLYSLVLAYTNDWLGWSQIQAASSTMVRINGMGAVVGPVLAAGLMSRYQPSAFYLVIAASCALVAAFVGYRMMVIDGLPAERQLRYIRLPVRGTAVATQLLPKFKSGRPSRRQARRQFFAKDSAFDDSASEESGSEDSAFGHSAFDHSASDDGSHPEDRSNAESNDAAVASHLEFGHGEFTNGWDLADLEPTSPLHGEDLSAGAGSAPEG